MVEDISRNVNAISQHSHTNSNKMQDMDASSDILLTKDSPAQIPGADLPG